jgi:hypothetical protein
VKRTLQTLLCVLTALHLCGGHLGVFQFFAWAEMLRDYTQKSGLLQGVKETFDGEHPCAMCCKIDQARKDESKQNPLPLEKIEKLSKWLGLLPEVELPRIVWTSLSSEHDFAAPAVSLGRLTADPATPPPRAIA